jgi:hypothetical protein
MVFTRTLQFYSITINRLLLKVPMVFSSGLECRFAELEVRLFSFNLVCGIAATFFRLTSHKRRSVTVEGLQRRAVEVR